MLNVHFFETTHNLLIVNDIYNSLMLLTNFYKVNNLKYEIDFPLHICRKSLSIYNFATDFRQIVCVNSFREQMHF